MTSTTTKSSLFSAAASLLSLAIVSPVSAVPYFKSEATTYAEQVREIEAVGGDPTFLEPPTAWDGTEDESAHFGGWEGRSSPKVAVPKQALSKLSYQERKKEIEAVGGDPSFLDETPSSSGWDGSIDEGAYFGGWEN